jgi:type IV fimbrial biogenesis protein FimT
MKIFTKKGFTLVELMIVMVVMGIISAIASPNFRQFMAERRLNGAARMVLSDLMLARQQAVVKNNNFKVFFSTNHNYTILDDGNNDGSAGTGETSTSRDIHQDYYDVTFAATANPVFSPRGTSTGWTTVTLTSAVTGGSKQVRVNLTGRVRIVDIP